MSPEGLGWGPDLDWRMNKEDFIRNEILEHIMDKAHVWGLTYAKIISRQEYGPFKKLRANVTMTEGLSGIMYVHVV